MEFFDRVLETTTTTGTGEITFSGAVAGFRTFASVLVEDDTCNYAIFAVDEVGVPTGDWETGIGTFNAEDALERTTVSASSNAGAAVDFAAGTKHVMLSANATTLVQVGAFPATQTEAGNYTVDPADVGNYIRLTSASTKTVTVEPQSTTALPANGEWTFRNVGAGDATLVAGSGVTINVPAGGTLVVPQGGTVTLKRAASDVFDLMGQVEAA